MAKLFGKEYTKKALLSSVGDLSQLCGIRIAQLEGGRSEGVKTAHCWTGSGLEFDVILGRGMGLGAFRYKGVPFGWISATGDVASSYHEFEGEGFDRSHAGGLMFTAGLRQVGAPCEDKGEILGRHGRIANLPASNIHVNRSWNGNDYTMTLSGEIKECQALGENLILYRDISFCLGGDSVNIYDRIENAGYDASPLQLLYHTNYGFPLIDDGTRMLISAEHTIDEIDGAIVDAANYEVIKGLGRGERDVMLLHNSAGKDGQGVYGVVNDGLSLGLSVSYDSTQLPNIVHWMNLRPGRNVVEIGPTNATGYGRRHDRESDVLEYIAPGETRIFSISFTVVEGSSAIAEMEEQFRERR